MAGNRGVPFACLVIFAYIFGNGPRMSSAQTTGGHNAVERVMCTDLPNICPCNANKLQVIAGNKPLVCGASQTVASMAALPTIKPPTGVTLDQDALYTVVIIDRDPPGRSNPSMRYWLHGLFSDIGATDLSKGDTMKGTVLMRYAGPMPPPTTGAHSFQVLLLKQDPTVGGSKIKLGKLVGRGRFDAQAFLTTHKMCSDGQLIGAFEFHCSNPDGADPKNPMRHCPDLRATVPDAMTAGSGATTSTATHDSSTTSGREDSTQDNSTISGYDVTTQKVSGASDHITSTASHDSTQDNSIISGHDVTTQEVSGASDHSSFLHALVSVALLRVLLF